jgi:hypothetical protein
MSNPSSGPDRDDCVVRASSASPLAEALELLAALGWTQALFKIKEAQWILATSRAGIYRDVAAGRLEAVKNGNATRITAESVARRLASLTRAQVRSAPGRNEPVQALPSPKQHHHRELHHQK